MNLTKEQNLAMDAIANMQKDCVNGGQIVLIAGAAGTGKSSLIRFICEEQFENDKTVLLLAPTGKAALRIQEVSGVEAKTIHRWLYTPEVDKETGKVKYALRETVEKPTCGFIVIDEVSMLDLQIFTDIYNVARNSGLNLVLVGDSFQLPPIKDDFSVFNPALPTYKTIKMNSILRQAEESPIIRVCTAIRNKDWTTALKDIVRVSTDEFHDLSVKMVKTDNVNICYKNSTRNALNRAIRKEIHNTNKVLVENEKILVNKNNYALDVFNGEVCDVIDVNGRLNALPLHVVDVTNKKSQPMTFYDVKLAQGNVVVSDVYLQGKSEVGEYWQELRALELIKAHNSRWMTPPTVLHANYGYALTAHRAQGSEWDEALVLVENQVMHDYSWVYTAASRAKNKLYIKLGDL
jgi:exodeoxyribonuclease-5